MTNKYLTKLATQGHKTDVAAAGTGLDNTGTAPRASLKTPEKVTPVAASMSMPRALPTLAKTAGVVQGAKDFYKGLHTIDKVKIGMSATGLGLGAVGFVEGHRKLKGDRHRENVEVQSLATLKKIHEALERKPDDK